jgi:hypothetical protein
MSDDDYTRHSGSKHQGPGHSAPYPLSRLAPAFDLVDVAREIQKADALIVDVASDKLRLIAEQIQALQAQAHEILADARRDAELHRAACNFVKRPGKTYHLYRKADGGLYFSMLSPEDWNGRAPDAFEGSYRLEVDLSWTPADKVASREPHAVEVRRLLGAGGRE